jgi:hypothetical protein
LSHAANQPFRAALPKEPAPFGACRVAPSPYDATTHIAANFAKFAFYYRRLGEAFGRPQVRTGIPNTICAGILAAD